MSETAPAPAPTAQELADLARQLVELLRLRTLPIGMKLLRDAAALEAIPGLRRPPPGRRFTTCQLVTQARIAGFTLGITHDNVPPFSNCGGGDWPKRAERNLPLRPQIRRCMV